MLALKIRVRLTQISDVKRAKGFNANHQKLCKRTVYLFIYFRAALMEVPTRGVKRELKLLAYTTARAIAMLDLS